MTSHDHTNFIIQSIIITQTSELRFTTSNPKKVKGSSIYPTYFNTHQRSTSLPYLISSKSPLTIEFSSTLSLCSPSLRFWFQLSKIRTNSLGSQIPCFMPIPISFQNRLFPFYPQTYHCISFLSSIFSLFPTLPSIPLHILFSHYLIN